MILLPFLAGAGIAAVLEAILALPISGLDGVHREYALVSLASTWLGCLLAAVGLALVLRIPIFSWFRGRLEKNGAIWAGFFAGLMPIFGSLFPVLYLPGSQHWLNLGIWLVLPAVAVIGAPWLNRIHSFSPTMVRRLFVIAPVAWVVTWVLPSQVMRERPPAPEVPAVTTNEASLRVGVDHPDLVLISIDTLRSDLMRGTEFLIPYIQEQQSRGTWAPYALSPSNQTVPGHVAMLTGLEPGQHGISRNIDKPPLVDLTYLADRLRDGGYRTAAVVSNNMLLGRHGWANGFDVYDDTDAEPGGNYFLVHVIGRLGWPGVILSAGRSFFMMAKILGVKPSAIQPPGQSRYATSQAVRYMETMAQGTQPFHLFLHVMDPHAPYMPPEETRGRFADPDDLPQKFRRWSYDQRTLINKIDFSLDEGDEDALVAADHLLDLYHEEILFMDSRLRQLFAAVEEGGRPTLVVITSDHGEFFGEHKVMEHARYLFEPVIRVPFVCFGLNGLEVPARQLSHPIGLIDVAPTFLSAAGLPVPEEIHGRDLRAPEVLPMDHIGRWSSMASIRRGPFKLIVRLLGNGEVQPLGLFNIDQDPGELLPLFLDDWDDSERALERMRQLALEVEKWDATMTKVDATVADRKMAEALGYFDHE